MRSLKPLKSEPLSEATEELQGLETPVSQSQVSQSQDPVLGPLPVSLGQQTLRGFTWLMIQSVGTKLVGLAGQVILAWLLRPQDFGVIGLAYTVSAFAGLIQQAGLLEILVQRQSKFKYWANIVFWMSMTAGLISALVMVIAAPIAAKGYNNPLVAPLILILAVAAPLNALSIVPSAQLQIQLRFRAIALIGSGQAIGTMCLSVLLAKLGYGPYSFVLPQVVTSAIGVTVLWLTVKPPVRWNLQWRRWRYLIPDSGLLFTTSLLMMVTMQGDYIILGLRHTPHEVGIYFFAFNLSLQVISLFTGNIGNVLFPVLTKLQDDPARQTDAFLKAIKLLALLGVPACLLQAALADPLIRALFAEKWHPAIPLLQILSLGMAMRVVAFPSISLLKAQGRFQKLLRLYIFYAVIFLLLAMAGAFAGGSTGVAIAVSIYSAIIGAVSPYLVIRPAGRNWHDIGTVYAIPLAAGMAAVGTATGLAMAIPDVPGRHWLRAGFILCGTIALYTMIIYKMSPLDWQELAFRFSGIWQRKLKDNINLS